MTRQNLGALLGNIDDDTSAATEGMPESAEPAKPTPGNRKASVAAHSREPQESSTGDAVAPYLRFVRKDTRLREEQQNQLTLHARRLNRASPVGSARITDNTLIRVAVDLLLARIETATGGDERAILESLNQ